MLNKITANYCVTVPHMRISAPWYVYPHFDRLSNP